MMVRDRRRAIAFSKIQIVFHSDQPMSHFKHLPPHCSLDHCDCALLEALYCSTFWGVTYRGLVESALLADVAYARRVILYSWTQPPSLNVRASPCVGHFSSDSIFHLFFISSPPYISTNARARPGWRRPDLGPRRPATFGRQQ